MSRSRTALAFGAAAAVAVAACSSDAAPPTTGSTESTEVAPSTVAVAADSPGVIVTEGKLSAEWENFGWTSTIDTDGRVEVDLGGYGGWIAARRDLAGSYSDLRIAVTAPESLGDQFLIVQLADDVGSSFPSLTPTFRRDGTSASIQIPLGSLAPNGAYFDRVILSAGSEFDIGTTMTVDELLLVPSPDDGATAPAGTGGQVNDTTPPEESVPAAFDIRPAEGLVECAAETRPISPHIYGTNRPFLGDNDTQWLIDPPSRRWGGNTTSRYNWRLGAWNTGSDYFFQNVEGDGDNRLAHEQFVVDNWANGAESAMTIPMLGWVAKDTTSSSFLVSQVGPQQDTDPFRPDAGNGLTPDGDEIAPPDPSQTSIQSTPDDVGAWVTSMVETANANGQSKPFMYFLDNEPMLWNSTHRDVVTEPVGYDELLRRTIDYGTAVRNADPDALIAGPSLWGWPAYLFSAIDAEAGFDVAPDRQAHGNQPLIEWYLDQLRVHEEQTGVRLLDVLDLHFYPQDGSYSDDVSEGARALRLRSTRNLWSAGYNEESYIETQVELIPRMQAWADEHYPGLKLSLGEYSFGAERDISGGLAQAEALGRFGQNGLFSAYYWVTAPANSPVYWAFRAYRNYDGEGSQFGELSVPTESDWPLSVFASATNDGDRNVLVLLNLTSDEQLDTTITLDGCNGSNVRAWRFDGAPAGLAPTSVELDNGTLTASLDPYTMTVVELS